MKIMSWIYSFSTDGFICALSAPPAHRVYNHTTVEGVGRRTPGDAWNRSASFEIGA